MNKWIYSIILTLIFGSFCAKANFANKLNLKTGDILLQPLHCWLCSLIEAQEESIYSHIGIVLKEKESISVLEAWGSVRKVNLKEFLSKTQKDQKVLVRRSLMLNDQISDINFSRLFKDEFAAHPYDVAFLWNNVDENGDEKFYCSELVKKMLDPFVSKNEAGKIMKFDINRKYWVRFFKGSPPDGEWGISPADFERSSLFETLGEL